MNLSSNEQPQDLCVSEKKEIKTEINDESSGTASSGLNVDMVKSTAMAMAAYQHQQNMAKYFSSLAPLQLQQFFKYQQQQQQQASTLQTTSNSTTPITNSSPPSNDEKKIINNCMNNEKSNIEKDSSYEVSSIIN